MQPIIQTEEIVFPGEVARGASGMNVRRVQEWLCLHGFRLEIDDDFGTITDRQVRAFQESIGVVATGVVDSATFAALVAPMTRALCAPDLPAGATLPVVYGLVADQHLAAKPREIGGENRGPYIRLYMHGEEGSAEHWCAGSVWEMLKQACLVLSVEVPFGREVNCTALKNAAEKVGRFVPSQDGGLSVPFEAAGIFIQKNPDKPGRYKHTGVARRFNADDFGTIEGNFSGRGGDGMYRYVRAYGGSDFISLV